MERNVHHAEMIPSRTCIAKPVQSDSNHKWSSCFERWVGEKGAEKKAAKMTSAPLFLSQELAMEAANRAMDVLEKTGMFPNMCEEF